MRQHKESTVVKNPFLGTAGVTHGPPNHADSHSNNGDAPRRLICRRGALALAFALPACSAIERGTAVPAPLQDSAIIPGIPNARFWGDTQVDALRAEVFAALEREARHLGLASGRDLRRLPPAHLLALSGGSDYGAFGAGVLVGWTETGTRPEFKLVTGVSTGALTAPLAFIGPSKDPVLREVYTGIGPDQIFRRRDWLSIPFSDSLTDTRPLLATISRHMDAATLATIAEEYRKGRALLIGTTNLDSMRPCIWNIGAIAASGQPDALDLVRRIMLASASVPTVFPPVMFEVESGGRRFQEMHVDGGAVAQTFLYPPGLTRAARDQAALTGRERHAWVIRNARLGADWQQTERAVLTIAGRAISSMIAYSGQNDIIRLQTQAERDGVNFNLAYIKEDFTLPWERPFDRAWMKALFENGRQRALEGRAWDHTSPFLAGGRRPTLAP
ncbi:MAG: patatin-like phospholipase family protein [Roseomonas sp.]|nr:patatin-like phospholipase family protein [Roseomonas sp.]